MRTDGRKEKADGQQPGGKDEVIRFYRFKRGGDELSLLGTVKALLKDAELVLDTIARTSPVVIALTCNKEEASGLRRISKIKPQGFDLREREDVQALARLLWSWNCECGESNEPQATRCRKCGRPGPAGPGGELSGRSVDGRKPGHGALDNLWVEPDTPTRPREEGEEKYGIGDVLTHHDQLYMEYLLGHGEVRYPSPAFLSAVKAARERKMLLEAVDMPEEEFTDMHLKEVGYLDLMSSTSLLEKLEKKGLRMDTPEEFALEWDRRHMSVKGYARVEDKRSFYMARRLDEVVEKYGNTLCVCELERVRGLAGHLEDRGFKRVGEKA